MNKLKVLSIVLLLSCMQMHAADNNDGTTSPVLMAEETNNKLPKKLIDDIEREDPQCINSKEMNENAIGSMARRGSRRCCGSLWTGGVWLVTSIGSLAGFGSNTVEASKKKK